MKCLSSLTHCLGYAWLFCCLVSGCGGGGVKTENITGNVTFAGQPVVYGLIEFIPDKKSQHEGPAGSAEIIDGKFDTAQGGIGIVPGPHLVRITAYEERPQAGSGDETQVVENKPPLFIGFTIEASIGAGGRNFDVPAEAKGFDLMKDNVKRAVNEP